MADVLSIIGLCIVVAIVLTAVFIFIDESLHHRKKPFDILHEESMARIADIEAEISALEELAASYENEADPLSDFSDIEIYYIGDTDEEEGC